ncbi:Nuclear pore complex protein NUP214 [Zea mays]|uniref:Nuclear pore complex protein NUP214 n=1 Tax=Zea mays TaxID=4577 RepID=A0A1D6PYH8_MAIZE|nr:Nuclear pore complex protein NUP214 [Zea mays]
MCLEVPALVPAGSPNANKSKSRGNDPDDDMYLMDLDGNNLKPDSTSAELGTLNEALQELIKEISSGVRENDYLTDDGVFCSGLLQVFKGKVEEQCSKIEDLRNNMFQVFARQTYMKGIVSQSSDNQYWDIWNRQKLSPEFEVKRQNILRANQRSHMSQQLEGNQHLPNPIHSALGAKIMWWLVCFIAQFGQSLVRADYLILRKGFIMVVEKSLLSVAVIPAFADGLYVYTLTRLTSKSWESQFFSLRDSFFLVM